MACVVQCPNSIVYVLKFQTKKRENCFICQNWYLITFFLHFPSRKNTTMRMFCLFEVLEYLLYEYTENLEVIRQTQTHFHSDLNSRFHF